MIALGIIIGMVIGGFVGFFAAILCVAASREEEFDEYEK